MKLLPLMLLPLLIVGCVDLTVEDTLIETNQVSFPAPPIPPGVSVPPQTVDQIITFDISSAVNELEKQGKLHLTVEENSLSGDISFLSHLTLQLTTSDQPPLTLVDTDVNSTATLNYLPMLVAGDAMLPLLTNPCGLHFIITGSVPASGVNLTSRLVINVSEEIK